MSNLQWGNDRALQLLDAAERVLDPVKQRALFEQIHGLMRQDIPIIGLYNEYAADVNRNTIEGYEPWSMGRPRLWGVSKAGSTGRVETAHSGGL